MKKILVALSLASFLFTSCLTLNNSGKTKAQMYTQMYEERPLTIIIMNPVNKTTVTEAGNFFYTTLHEPLAEAGYYVLPPFITQNVLKTEGRDDSSKIKNSDLKLFADRYGTDAAFFTTITKWEKSVLLQEVRITVEYTMVSTRSGKVLFHRYSEYVDDKQDTSSFKFFDVLFDAIDTAVTKEIDVARRCNFYSLQDIPVGKYHPQYKTDGEAEALKEKIILKK